MTTNTAPQKNTFQLPTTGDTVGELIISQAARILSSGGKYWKTNLQNILIACAMNLMRIARWLQGEYLAQSRLSDFACLYQTAAVSS
jgi:hypothetical protein